MGPLAELMSLLKTYAAIIGFISIFISGLIVAFLAIFTDTHACDIIENYLYYCRGKGFFLILVAFIYIILIVPTVIILSWILYKTHKE